MRAPFSLATTVMLSLALASFARAIDRQTLPGHVPEAVSRLTPTGRLEASRRLNLAIGLPLRNQGELAVLLHNLYDPRSQNYRRYLSPKQFAGRFGPTERDYETVAAFAESNGLHVAAKHSNRLLIEVNGAVADIEKAFHVKLLTYGHPAEPRAFFAPDTEPSMDLQVPLAHVLGLDDYRPPRPASPQGTVFREFRPVPNGGSAPGGAFLGLDFRKAYAPGVSLSGAGQTVGLLEFDGYFTNDIVSYEAAAGLPSVTLTNVLLDTYDGLAGQYNFEVALDIEMTVAMAPGLSRVIVYESGIDNSADVILNRMATDNLASQLSSSWLWGVGTDPVADEIFQEFAAQGQSFFVACGDVDAYTSPIPFPADDSLVTSVGGTTLATAANGSWSGESAWNLDDNLGGSGGISPTFLIPDWQVGVSMVQNQGSVSNRNIPDVAMVAYYVWVVYNDGQSNAFAGTSCAAPLWAGFTSLVNQQAAAYGQPPVGFLNPALYTIGQGNSYAACFHDITSGNNTNQSSPNRFFATTGYDLCTGWGTPAGQPLIDVLEPPDYLLVSPRAFVTASGLPGGPLNPPTATFTVANQGPTPLDWSAGTAADWLTLSTNQGALPPGGAQVQIVLTLNSRALLLPAGDYVGLIAFTNNTTGVVRQGEIDLQIAPTLARNGGFETGDFSNWELDGSPLGNTVSSGPPIPHSGNYYASLHEYGSLAYLSQSLPTTPGQSALLSFWLDNSGAANPNQFQVNWNTNTILNLTNLGSFDWTNFQFLVTASDTNSVLQFGWQNNIGTFGLDDVSVTPVPAAGLDLIQSEPDAITLSWTALPELVYQVQYRTNLAAGAWQNLGVAISGASGQASATDAIGPDPQRYYRIVVGH